MHSECLNCIICLNEFNRATFIPKTLPCGHTICSVCLHDLLQIKNFTCPMDRKPFPAMFQTVDFFPTNIIILQLLDEQTHSEYGLCPDHNQPNDLICLTDKCRVCKYCADFGHHKGHEIRPFTDVKNDAKLISQNLGSLVNEFDADCKAIFDLLENKKRSLLSFAEQRFVYLRQLLDIQFQKIRSEIECIFSIQASFMKTKLQRDLEFKKALQQRIYLLDSMTMNNGFFKTLKGQGLGTFIAKNDFKEFSDIVDSINKKFEKSLMALEGLVGPTIERFQFDFPQELTTFFDLEEKNGWLVLTPVDKNKEERNPKEDVISNINWRKARAVWFQFKKTKPSKTITQVIRYIWREFTEMTDVNIDISKACFADKELLSLCFHNFWDKEKIQRFGINLSGCNSITDQSAGRIVGEIISNMKNLKYLYLNFGETKVTDRTLEVFTETVLPTLTGLEKFHLYLHQTKVTDLSIEKLCLVMPRVTMNIQAFELSLISTHVTDRSIQAFVNYVLPTMTGVKDLKLYLYQTQVSDISVQKLCENMKMYLKNLASFVLNLDLTNITDNSAIALTEYLVTKANTMKKLEIYLNHTRISDFHKNAILSAQEKLVVK